MGDECCGSAFSAFLLWRSQNVRRRYHLLSGVLMVLELVLLSVMCCKPCQTDSLYYFLPSVMVFSLVLSLIATCKCNAAEYRLFIQGFRFINFLPCTMGR